MKRSPENGSKSRPGVAATCASASIRRANCHAVVGEAGDIAESVERAVHRRGQPEPDLRQPPHQQFAVHARSAPSPLRARRLRRKPRSPRSATAPAAKCRGSAAIRSTGRTSAFRQHHPADPPAGHAVVFGERVDDDDFVAERQRGHVGRRIGEAVIDLVRDRGDAELRAGRDELFEIGRRNHCAGRIGRAGEQHALQRLFGMRGGRCAAVQWPRPTSSISTTSMPSAARMLR